MAVAKIKLRTKGQSPQKAAVSKWGNSLGVRIPKAVAEELKLTDGAELSVQTYKGGILLQPVKVRRRYTTAELCGGVKPGHIGGEMWKGPAVGREVW